jgi:hypothetical protein
MLTTFRFAVLVYGRHMYSVCTHLQYFFKNIFIPVVVNEIMIFFTRRKSHGKFLIIFVIRF